MSQIFENLFLGDAEEASSFKFLNSHGITHILTMALGLKPVFPTKFEYLCIPALDSEDFKINEFFPEICDFINKAILKGGKVFVHCAYGVSRSPTAIIAYLISNKGMSYEKARNYVQDKRDLISPNSGFIEQLKEFEKKCAEKRFPWRKK